MIYYWVYIISFCRDIIKREGGHPHDNSFIIEMCSLLITTSTNVFHFVSFAISLHFIKRSYVHNFKKNNYINWYRLITVYHFKHSHNYLIIKANFSFQIIIRLLCNEWLFDLMQWRIQDTITGFSRVSMTNFVPLKTLWKLVDA